MLSDCILSYSASHHPHLESVSDFQAESASVDHTEPELSVSKGDQLVSSVISVPVSAVSMVPTMHGDKLDFNEPHQTNMGEARQFFYQADTHGVSIHSNDFESVYNNDHSMYKSELVKSVNIMDKSMASGQ